MSVRYCRIESRVEYCDLNLTVTIVIFLLRPSWLSSGLNYIEKNWKHHWDVVKLLNF